MISLRGLRCVDILLVSFGKLSTTSTAHAGHSHWQNVRHIKAAKDKEKSNRASYFSNLIRKAMREKQPKQRIKEIVLNARAAQVPQATIDRAMNDSGTVDPYVVVGRAAGGIMVLIESTCPKAVTERQRMSQVFKKYGFKANENLKETATITREFFDHTGFIICEINDKMSNLDEATEIGLEIGAEEVEHIQLSDNESLFQFQCPPRELPQLTRSLSEIGASVMESEDRYSPKELVLITAESYKNMEDMYRKLHDNCDAIERIFDNVEVS